MEKGVIRFEPNISVRPAGSTELRTRTELKNLNSFRALERGTQYEIERQIEVWESGGQVLQETRGWSEAQGRTLPSAAKNRPTTTATFPSRTCRRWRRPPNGSSSCGRIARAAGRAPETV